MTILEEWHAPFADDRNSNESKQRAGDPDLLVDEPIPDEAISRNSHYLGNNPADWFSDLPRASSTSIRDIRPGIDLNCYADQNRLEYVFVFWPGVDPQDVEFTYDSAHNIEYTASRNVAIEYECATLIQHRPMTYKWHNGLPTETPSTYTISGKTVGFDFVDSRAPSAAAIGGIPGNSPILRPIVDYLSYLGGEGKDQGYAITVDHAGYAYLAGTSTSPDFSAGNSGAGSKRTDNADVFVAKIRLSDRKIMYTSFLGGRHDDRAFDIAADAEGNVYLCGETLSPDFSTITPPPGGVLGRGWDAFVVKLDPSGAIGNFAFRIGGRGDDHAFGIALDAATNIYLAGVTRSPDFPSTPGSYGANTPNNGENADTFIVKLAPNGRDLLYSARFGGSGEDLGFAFAVDRDGAAVVGGETTSTDLPLETPVQIKNAGGKTDGFIARLTPDGARLGFATYLGGKGDDRILGLDVDAARAVFVTGETASENFPIQGAVQSRFAGGQWDAFLTRLAPTGDSILYSTYLGGSGDDRGFSVSAEASGEPHVAGTTSSTNLPVVRPLQKEFGGGKWDAFVAGFSENGQDVHYLTYVGGTNDDQIAHLAMEAGHLLNMVGTTHSPDLPVVDPFQSAHRGLSDVLLARFLSGPPQSPPMRLVPAGGMPGGPFYDFLTSAFETTNEEFARFLNAAQASPDGPSGTNMYFDAQGNVWMSPDMLPERDEMFTLHDSRLVYDPAFPLGARYNVTPRASREGSSYARHPVAGASWYGAVKYCNWLTVETGRGLHHRCYREGTRPTDWAPVTCPPESWERGLFTSRQRHAWLRYKGFRLPMDNCAAPFNRSPMYFRVTNDEFADFLNDAEANPSTLRGTNVFVDIEGNANFSPVVGTATGRLFTIANSLLVFDPRAQAGSRYTVLPSQPGVQPPFAERPVANVSWYGAMKYCNWLTLMEGLAPEERAYREGPRAQDWAPTPTAHENWVRAEFTERERDAWLELKGYRLPFISDAVATNVLDEIEGGFAPTNSWPNAFNEVHKMAGWTGSTNVSFGFGRNHFDLHDANYLDSGMSARHDTTPVGFYDGSDHGGRFPTRTNDNLYGAFDLSGNVSEWVTDPGGVGSSADRAYYGGSWRFPPANVSDRFYVHPYFTENFMGFRVVTTAPSEEMHVARIPFRLCICGYGVGPGCGRGDGTDGDGEAEATPDGKPGKGLDIEGMDPLTGSTGIQLKPVPPPPPTVTSSPPGGGGGGRPPPPPPPTTTTDISDPDDGGGMGLVEICHRPPGNPDNPVTIAVPLAAVPQHLAHGDTLGACP